MKLWVLLTVLLIAGCGKKDMKITNLKMLEGGKTFAVPTGGVADQFVLKKFPDAKIEYYNTVLDCAIAAQTGKADAAVYDKPVLLNIAGKNKGLTVLSELLFDDQYGFAVQIQNKELKRVMDEVLDELKSNGTYEDMKKRWFPEKGNPAPMPQIDLQGEKGVLRFGTAAITEPMSFVDENHKIVGFDIEFATYIAKKLNKNLEITDMEFGAMLPALISGKVDMIGAGLSITEERAKKVLFSECYYPSGIAALVKSDDEVIPTPTTGLSMSKLEDIHDKRIGVLMGSVHDVYATKHYPEATILQFQNVSDLLTGLKTGKVDVSFFGRPALKDILSKNPELGILVDTAYLTQLGVAFNKEDQQLLSRFNKFLKEIKSNGVYDDMFNRYVRQNSQEMPVIPLGKTIGELKVGVVSDIGMPFTILKDGHLVGFDIEIATRFAASIGKKPVLVDMPFGSLLAAISTRKIEMITSSMMITEERQKQVNFSDPYFESAISVAARKTDILSVKSDKLKMLSDISDRKIGVLLGSIHDAYAIKHYPNAEILQFQSSSDLLLALTMDKVDVAFYDFIALKDVFAKNKEIGILEESVFVVDIAAGFNKDSDPLRTQFNAFLKEIKSNGIYNDMVKRWMDDGVLDMPDIKNPAKNGTVKFGIVSDGGLPFSLMQNGQLTGFDIELGKRFAAAIGKEYVPVDMPFGSLIAAISTNKIDVITASMMVSDERKKRINFSEPYYRSAVSVIAKKEKISTKNKGTIRTLDDFADKKIGIFTGTVHDAFLSKKYPKAQIFRYESTPDMILSLKSGKIDAAMLGHITAKVIMRGNPELTILSDEKIYDLPLGVGFNKNNPALRNEFNAFIQKIRTSGVFDSIHKRWFEDDPEIAVMPDFRKNSDGKKIIAGIATDDLPYVVMKNGKYVGFDVEIIQRFAEQAGYQVEFSPMQFSSLIAALAAGKVDMIADGIAITDERKKQIDFSDPYTFFKTVLIIPNMNTENTEVQGNVNHRKTFIERVKESFNNNIILEKRYLLIIDGLKVTLIISLFSAIFGTIIGGLICFMRMSKRNFLSATARLYISLLRGTPVLVLLMIIYYVVFASVNINPVLVAVVAFGMNFGAYVSEMFRTSIESVDKGQKEAGIAGGFTKIQTFIHIIMPQALRHVIPVYKGEFISLVKMTSIVGYIAVQDLTKASDIIRSRTFDAFFPLIMVAVFYLIIAWLLTWALSYVEISVDPKRIPNKKAEEVTL